MRIRQRARPASSRTIKPHVHDLRQVAIEAIRPAQRNARVHSKKQVAQIAASIDTFGFANPILVDEKLRVIGGHGRLEAAKSLGLTSVPVISVTGLTDPQKRALAIADNKIAESATWDRQSLAIELKELAVEVDFDLELTGFSTAEIDLLLDPPAPLDKEDEIPDCAATAVSIAGDIWTLGNHRLVVGDVLQKAVLRAVMQNERAHAVFVDIPYNVPIRGHVRGTRRTKHREFAMASGEMSDDQFDQFIKTGLENLAAFSRDGSISMVCIDWRHVEQLLRVGRSVYSELKNLAVWVKTNAGMGSFFRSQHELVVIFKLGSKPHQNNFGLGRDGRYRSNVWTYAGVNAFQARRKEELEMHPTVKPVALVADAIKDVTRRNQIVLDGFAGSGTTLIAAEKTGRVARCVEIDPLYADVTVRRWQDLTGEKAHHAETGASFAKTAKLRAGEEK